MKTLNNLGIHVFEQTKDLDWEREMLFVNLLSALTWKKYQGPIHLYCNKRYLETLRIWGIDTVYDFIDTETLENKPNNIDYKQYWAFGKLLVLEKLINKEPFIMVDTDLWVNESIEFDNNCDVQMYHNENFDLNFKGNTYPDFDFLIPDNIKELNLDKNVLPTNCALLKINNTNFIPEWIELAKTIATFNKEIKISNGHQSSKMCFVEQRLLPMLLQKRGLNYKTLINQVYQTHKAEIQDGSEWLPRIDQSSYKDRYKFESIKHVWGLKSFFKHLEIKEMVMRTTIQIFSQFDATKKPYSRLVDAIKEDHRNDVNQLLASLSR